MILEQLKSDAEAAAAELQTAKSTVELCIQEETALQEALSSIQVTSISYAVY
jgi:hypothetical protein